MTRDRQRPSSLPIFLAGTLLLTGCAVNRNQILPAPFREEVPAEAPAFDTSHITVDLALPLSDIQSFIDAVPEEHDASGSITVTYDEMSRDAGAAVPDKTLGGLVKKGSSDFFRLFSAGKSPGIILKWALSVTRDRFEVFPSPENGGMRFDEWITIHGILKCDGPIKIKGLDKSDFKGQMRIRTDLSIPIDPKGEPVLRIVHQPQWVDKPVWEIVKGVKIDTSAVADDVVPRLFTLSDGLLEKAFSKIYHVLLARYWRAYPLAVAFPGAGRSFLNIQPVRLGLSGTTLSGAGPGQVLHLVGSVTAKTSVDPSPLVPSRLPLPKAVKIPRRPGELELFLPVHLPYDRIASEIKKVVANKIHRIGDVDIRILDVDLYPARGGVAVAVHLNKSFSSNWWDLFGLFNTSGWIYLVGKPAVRDNQFHLDNLQLAQKLDNPLWIFGIDFFNQEICSDIAQAATIVDLGVELKDASEALQRTIQGITQDGVIPVGLENPVFSPRIIPSKDLILEVELKAGLKTQVDLDHLLN